MTAQHPLVDAIENVAREIDKSPSEEMRIWAVAALASRLRLPVLIGDDALPLDRPKIPGAGPSYLVHLDLDEPGDFYVEGGYVSDVVVGVESVGRAWLGLVEAMNREHPDRASEVRSAALLVVADLVAGDGSVGAIAEAGERWAAMVSERLDDRPDRQADTLRAAYGAVQKGVDEVRKRGLTKDQRAPLRA